MTAYILRRLVLLIPVILVVGIVVFALVHLTPGDPAAVILGDSATPEAIANLREQLGLNDPLPVQFLHWFGYVLTLGVALFVAVSRKNPLVPLSVATLAGIIAGRLGYF